MKRLEYFVTILLGFTAAAGLAIGARHCVVQLNNRGSLHEASHDTIRHPRGWAGHVDVTEHKDGGYSLALINDGDWINRKSSLLYEDYNGDCKVDSIRITSGHSKGHYLESLLNRKYDYVTHKATFEVADMQLAKYFYKCR